MHVLGSAASRLVKGLRAHATQRSHRTLASPAAHASSMRYHEHPLLLPAAQGAAELDLNSGLRQALAFCTDSLQQRNGVSGDTPYTGGAGVAFALWRAACLTHDAALLEQARQLAHQALAAIQGGRAGRCVRESLLDGAAGVVLINCLMSMAGEQSPAAQQQQQQLLAEYADICVLAAQPESRGTSDEFLYGRAGTLFGALLLRHQRQCQQHRQQQQQLDAGMQALARQMLASGRALAARLPVFAASGAPLAYLWPPGRGAEPYLGAAHGLVGILYVLLLAAQHAPGCLQQPGDGRDIAAALGYVLSCERDAPGAHAGSGGHYPTLMQLQGLAGDGADGGGERSTLVHWCHGAPGAVFLWCAAHEVLGGADAAYLRAAERAGELVWARGLLKKGPGLCHGVSGNAYALLRLWRATRDDKWLQRARAFAGFMVSEAGRADWSAPHNGASLFEGLAGGVCLLAELSALDGAATPPPAVALAMMGFPLIELVQYGL